ncbi:MAG: mandelate racemase [Acidimicrobiaceae bacterium]|nr:mandelate racemase [Acidimicrobiaceae bacterium]
MKIKSVTPFTVTYPEPNDNDNIRYLTFCKVEAEDGTVGWGEAISQFAESTKATATVIEGMSRHVIGRDAFENVAIWRAIKGATWWYGWHGGVASFALSAIDIALWDLKGKLLGVPLIDLLGGAYAKRLPVIASTHVWRSSLEEEAERHGRYVHEEGYLGVKIGMGKFGDARLGYEIERDIHFVKLLREAIGPTAMLMMDRGQSLRWTVADAIRRTNAFEEYGLTWMEEPLEPTETESFKRLRQHSKCLIATGEREWDARGYREFIDSGVADVIGCDVGRVEGITGALKVIELVEDRDLWFNSHAWSSAVNTAASIALSGFTSRCLLQELKPVRNPMQHELVEEPFTQTGGYIEMPSRPGLGVEVRESVLEKYAL